jgi:alpha-L-rhamnosidase
MTTIESPTVDVLTPYDLTVEGLPQPLGIDAPLPRLSWKLASSRRGAAQTAYRIVAAADPEDLAAPRRLLWDSGKVESSTGLLIPWNGPRLNSATRYHWRVTVWDEHGDAAGVADSWFETGLLHSGDWAARWISRDPTTAPVVDPPVDHDLSASAASCPPPWHTRGRFTARQGVLRARAYATARGVYQLHVNGQRVGDAELAPGWTEYQHRINYQTYDVTGLIQSGENVVGAVVADGWYAGYVGFDARKPAKHWGSDTCFLAQLVIEYTDGSIQIAATGAGWEQRTGPIRYADLLMGEYVDARSSIEGWDTPDGVVSGFQPVSVGDADVSILVAQPDESIRATATVQAVGLDRRAKGRWIVDFGQNLVGRVRLTLHGQPAGTRVQIKHAEILDNGELYLANLRRAEATDVYVGGGAPVEVFEPKFTFHGFRYAELSGVVGDVDIADAAATVLHNDFPWTGEFSCSDPLVNQLQSNITWGQRSNFLAVPTDCPQRDERLGWLADAQIFAPTATRNANVWPFLARWLRDVRSGVDEDGAFRDVAPILVLDREGAPAWGDAGVIIPWLLYKTYGDLRVLEDSIDSMIGWVGHIRRHNPDGIWARRTGNSYGDWLQVDAQTPRDVLSTAYYAHSVDITSQAATALGRNQDAEELRQLHDFVRAAFVDRFVSPDGRVHGDTQTAYLLALGFDLLPEDLRQSAAEHLASDVRHRGCRLTTGFVGVSLLCPVLADAGYVDTAYALLQQTEYPSWGYSIRHGATTIWERWDGWTEQRGFQSSSMNSFNHYSLGSVGDWLFGRVAGIDQTPDSIAFQRLRLRPTPGGNLSWARARQETARGKVSCSWRLNGDAVIFDIEVPPSVSASLRIPTGDPRRVTESGQPAADAVGVLNARSEKDALELELASGKYTFVAPA